MGVFSALGSIGGSFFGPWGTALGGALGSALDQSQQESPEQATQRANPMAPYQSGWAQQLNELVNNPSSVTSTPGYQFNLEQGQQQLDRTLAKTGQTQSSNERIQTEKYGAGFASNAWQQQVGMLTNLMNGGAVGQAAYTAQNANNNQGWQQIGGMGADAVSKLTGLYGPATQGANTASGMQVLNGNYGMSG
jgi:hypothetical protein